METRCVLIVLAVCLLLFGPFAGRGAAEEIVGTVKAVEGAALVVRSGVAADAVTGDLVHEGDVLRTGPDGAMGVLFRDDSSLALGPDTEVAIDSFLFEPAAEELGIVTRMTKGTASYLTGKVARMRPESVRFETPLATIGVRGTKFLVKVEEE
jgi:hypothetical protein